MRLGPRLQQRRVMLVASRRPSSISSAIVGSMLSGCHLGSPRPITQPRLPVRASAPMTLAPQLRVTVAQRPAAGEIITRPDQVATGVIEARHIAPNGVGNAGLDRQVLRVRVADDGTRPAAAGNSTPA